MKLNTYMFKYSYKPLLVNVKSIYILWHESNSIQLWKKKLKRDTSLSVNTKPHC